MTITSLAYIPAITTVGLGRGMRSLATSFADGLFLASSAVYLVRMRHLRRTHAKAGNLDFAIRPKYRLLH